MRIGRLVMKVEKVRPSDVNKAMPFSEGSSATCRQEHILNRGYLSIILHAFDFYLRSSETTFNSQLLVDTKLYHRHDLLENDSSRHYTHHADKPACFALVASPAELQSEARKQQAPCNVCKLLLAY